MKKLLLTSIAFAALIAGPAAAADLARPVYRRPVVMPAPVYSWTGFYVGGNVGYSWGEARNAWNVFAPNSGGGGGATTCGPAGVAFCLSGSDSNNLNGAIGGLQIGYNWQTGNFLAGIETDIQLSGQKGDQLFAPGFVVFGGTGTASAAYSEKLSWLGTLRGRVGITAERLLFYATGGLAYGHVTNNGSATATGFIPPLSPCPAPGCPLAIWSDGVTKTGWTTGAGMEAALGGNWTWKAEYLYVDLGMVNTTFGTFPGCFGTPNTCIRAAASVGTISSRITDNIVRVGLNYKFSYAAAPAVYR
jgi:outer membrane immunogenic protein